MSSQSQAVRFCEAPSLYRPLLPEASGRAPGQGPQAALLSGGWHLKSPAGTLAAGRRPVTLKESPPPFLGAEALIRRSVRRAEDRGQGSGGWESSGQGTTASKVTLWREKSHEGLPCSSSHWRRGHSSNWQALDHHAACGLTFQERWPAGVAQPAPHRQWAPPTPLLLRLLEPPFAEPAHR